MEPAFLVQLKFFYHSMLTGSLLLGFTLILSFWFQVAYRNESLSKGIFFNGLVIFSWAIPSLAHLLSLVFPSQEGVIMILVFRILSTINNLFIMLALPYYKPFERYKNEVWFFRTIVGFIILVMLLTILDNITINGFQLGKFLIVLLDTLVSVGIVILLCIGLSTFFKTILPEVKPLRYVTYFITITLCTILLYSLFGIGLKLFDIKFAYSKPSYLLYIIHFCTVFYFTVCLILVSFYWYLALVNIKGEEESSNIDETADEDGSSADEVALPQMIQHPIPALLIESEHDSEILPIHLHIDFDTNNQVFVLVLRCKNGGIRDYRWSGSNCVYPFFYWVYLSVAMKSELGEAIQMRDAQVNRNKMVSLLGKDLKPKNIVTLYGEAATLNITAENITINKEIFKQNALKAKFREHITPFLERVEYDKEMFKKDFTYADSIFNTVYKELSSIK